MLFRSGAQLFAQSELRGNALAGTTSAFEASVGYVFMSMTSAETPRLNLVGVDANSILQFAPRWAAMVDLTFDGRRTSPAPDTATRFSARWRGRSFS